MQAHKKPICCGCTGIVERTDVTWENIPWPCASLTPIWVLDVRVFYRQWLQHISASMSRNMKQKIQQNELFYTESSFVKAYWFCCFLVRILHLHINWSYVFKRVLYVHLCEYQFQVVEFIILGAHNVHSNDVYFWVKLIS